MKLIGTLKTKASAQIRQSRVSVGFECYDRDLFDPELCYDRVAESGAKFARCQTGWARTEKTAGVYDFSWLDAVVDNLLQRGVTPWFNVGYGNPIYMPVTLACPIRNNDPSPISVSYLRDGKEVYAYWIPYAIEEERGVTERATITFDSASDIADPVAIDLLDGKVYEPSEGEWCEKTRTVSGLPVGEYPFLVCDRSTFDIE